jgi:multidrug efflux pump subunit AcrB
MVSASAASGYSSGDAIKAVKEVAKQTLPSGYGYEFSGLSRDEASSGSTTVIIFIICLVFVYIILCCLYESMFIPIVVMLSIPFGLLGSFLFCQDVRHREQHLHADGTDYAYRTCCRRPLFAH